MWHDAFAPSTWSNWALVIVGIGAIIAAWRTLGTLKKQTADTRKAADAALLNAQAVIDAERPWLLVPLGKEFSEIEAPCLIARLPGEYRISYCIFRVKNFGRSPAKVIETKWRLFTGIDRESIPNVAAYDSQDALCEDYTFPQDVITPLQATFDPDGMLTPQELEEIMTKRTRFLWLCGYLKYTDTFARKDAPIFETRICYRWVNNTDSPKPFWIMAGPNEYNRAT